MCGSQRATAGRGVAALPVLATALLIASSAPRAAGTDGGTETPPAATATTENMDTIIEHALADGWAYARLGELCDRVGCRLAGSPNMQRASAWAVETMRAANFDSVWTEPVTVPRWERGRESAVCTYPVEYELTMLGIGRSDGTGPDGIEAEILAVTDFEELEARADEAAGKIVLFDPPWEGYGKTVRYRMDGASAAARVGAVGCLIRSVTNISLATPHTGTLRFEQGVPRVPIAALALEDAARLHRLCDAGLAPRVRLTMEARHLGDTTCLNTLGEVRGRTRPDEIVVVAGHLDSWDTGAGAHDDGAGCVMALAAVRLLEELDLVPQRTLRVVLYTAEEIGGYGGRAYRSAHANEVAHHVAALECDSGAFPPRGFSLRGTEAALAYLQQLATGLAPLGPLEIVAGGAGVDINPLVTAGVPGIGLRVDGSDYFAYHHSPADTFDKIDPEQLARNVAAVAALIYAVAEADEPLPRQAADEARSTSE